jgi:hypothetical protein
MNRQLYEDFLDNPEQYAACERYWGQLVETIAESLEQHGEWSRWIPRHYADGTTPIDLDLLPIFDARSERLGRAFRIIQWRPEGDGVEIAAWLSNYEEEYVELPREELVINLSLTERSARIAQDLLRAWMNPETTVGHMRTLVGDDLGSRTGPHVDQ